MTSPSKRLSTRARDDAVGDRRAELTARVHAVALQLRASATAAPSYAAALERVLGVLVELAARARGRRWEEAHARRGVWDVGAIAGVRAALHETGLSGHVTGEDIGAAYEELMGARGRGDWRRRTGTHYTPRGLTEEVVRETLGPVLRRLGEGASSEALLGLRVLDPAMGCGAFVLEVCRQLGGAVSEAWSREGAHGDLDGEEREFAARWEVARRCARGVDKNGAAVELARGCVWLETGAREGGVAALVQGLRAGDSLVGVSWSQARRFDWREERDEENRSQETGGVIEEALEEARREIEAGVEGRWREVAGVISDALVGAYFSSERAGAREGARRRARGEVERWLEGGAKQPLEGALGELRGRGRALGAFHWELEYGEELLLGTGFDAVVGNPPFAGKNGVSAVGGRGLRDWLKTVHAGAHGNADLSAHFLRRASWALRGEGALGLITTNTIGQGDTRATGLVPVLGEGGGVVYRATRSREWPGAAAVSVSVVHVGFGEAAGAAGTAVLDGEAVGKINSRLRAGRERGEPARLGANAGLSYQGCIVLGKGFVLTEEERERLLAADARNEERIDPLIGGEEVNRSPTQAYRRYVINFGEASLEEAAAWPELLAIVRERVKPARARLRDNTDGRRRRKYWWQFGRVTPALWRGLATVPRALVTSIVTKHLAFSFQPPDRVFSHKLQVFLLPGYEHFAVLQSRVHERWARLLSSTLETRLNYSASDCFETFPLPEAAALDPRGALAAAGRALYEARARFMLETGQGLTRTYNALVDPEVTDARVASLRALHRELDRAALAAYGWTELAPPPMTAPRDAHERAALARFEDELLDRLFALNARRAAAEREACLHEHVL